MSATENSVLAGFVTRAQLVAELGCSTRTLIRYEHQGLPVIRRGALRLYSVERVRAWLLGENRRRARPGRAA